MINFSTQNDGAWFFFDEGDEELGGVCLRELSFEEHKKIKRATTKVTKRFKRGQVITDEKVDESKEMKMIFSYCIVDWKNVSIDNQEAECTLENKVKAMKSLDFVKFVQSCLDQLTEENKSIEEARLKNSESTSAGK